MKLQNMLLSPSMSTSVCAEEKTINEYTSPNLPPIQKSNLNQNYEAFPDDFPKCLEPTPLIEDGYLKDTFSASITFETFSTDLPLLTPSSSSTYSPSEPSSPSSSVFDIPIWQIDSSSSSAKISAPTSCRYAGFPRIKPKPVIKMEYSYPDCPLGIESSVKNDPSPLVSPIMMAASTAAIAASNQSYSQTTASNESNNGDNGKKRIDFPVNDTFDVLAKRKQDNSLEVPPIDKNENSICRSSAADRLMFLTKNAHIKRPRNAWIHFRCHYGQALKAKNPTLRAEEISKRASRRWGLLNDNEKKPWNQLAEQDKQAHKEAFPNYKYCPRRSNSAAFFSKQNIVPVRDLKLFGSATTSYNKVDSALDRRSEVKLDNIARRRLMKK